MGSYEKISDIGIDLIDAQQRSFPLGLYFYYDEDERSYNAQVLFPDGYSSSYRTAAEQAHYQYIFRIVLTLEQLDETDYDKILIHLEFFLSSYYHFKDKLNESERSMIKNKISKIVLCNFLTYIKNTYIGEYVPNEGIVVELEACPSCGYLNNPSEQGMYSQSCRHFNINPEVYIDKQGYREIDELSLNYQMIRFIQENYPKSWTRMQEGKFSKYSENKTTEENNIALKNVICLIAAGEQLVRYYRQYGFETDPHSRERDAYHRLIPMSTTLDKILNYCSRHSGAKNRYRKYVY